MDFLFAEEITTFSGLVLVAVVAGAILALVGAAIKIFLYFTYDSYKKVLEDKDSKDFQRLLNQIKNKDVAQTTYQALLGGFLDRIDWFFDRWGYERKNSPPSSTPGRPLTWTANAYDRCLLLAVAYPFVSAVLCWLAVGQTGDLGYALGLLDTDNTSFRAAMVLGFTATASLFILSMRVNDWKMMVFWFTGSGILIVTVYKVPDFFDESAVAFIVAGVVGFVLAFAGAFVVAILGILTVAGVVAFAVASDVAAALAVVLAVILIVELFIKKQAFGLFLCVFTITMVLGLGGAVLAVSTMDGAENGLTLLVALGVLPLVNAPFDWASLGLTRFLLRKNLEARSAWSRARLSLLDFGLALVALLLLALALVAALEAVNALAREGLGGDFVPVRAQLLAIDGDPWDGSHVWIYFTLFSTLIPTLLHAMIWCASLVTVRVPWLRTYLLDGMTHRIDDGDGTRNRIAAALTLRWGIAIVAVIIGVGMLWWLFGMVFGLGPAFLDLLLWWQALVAGWLA